MVQRRRFHKVNYSINTQLRITRIWRITFFVKFSQTSERDSLDENVVVSNNASEDFSSNMARVTRWVSPFIILVSIGINFTPYTIWNFPISQPKEASVQQNSIATFTHNGVQNDLNQNGNCHQNIYITSNGTSHCNGGIVKINHSLIGTATRTTSNGTATTTTIVKKLETTEL